MKTRVLYLYLLSVFLMWLTACQKEDALDVALFSEEPIRFDVPSILSGVEVRSLSRAPVDMFPTNGSFGVLGYCLANYDGSTELNPTTGPTPWVSKAVLCTPHLFYKTEVKYNGTACYYTGQQQRWYEPSDYLYTFLAYYPYSDTYYTVTPTTQSGIGTPSLTFTMPFSGGDVSTTLDIENIPDAMAAAAIDVTRQEGNVKLEFNHLLTGINFTVNNYNQSNDLVIHGLRVSGEFYRSLKIHLSKGLEYPSETFKGTFTFLDQNDDSDDVVVEHQKTAIRIGNKSLLLVSNLSQEARPNYIGNNINIYIDYSFMGKRVNNKEIPLPTGYLPQGGTLYTVEMNFIGNALILNFVVDNNQVWENGGDSEIKFE